MASRYPKMWVRPDLCEGLRDAREESTKASPATMTGVPTATSRPGSSPRKRVPRVKAKMGCADWNGADRDAPTSLMATFKNTKARG